MKVLNNGKAILIGLEYFNPDDYPLLEVVGCNCTGLDHLPWKQIKERNIKVISLKDYPLFLKTIFSTAEHTIGLIIALLRNYKTALNAPYQDREAYTGHILSGKTLGILGGNGRIGTQLAKIADAFGMKILVYDKKPCLPWRFEKKCFMEVGLDELLKESDIVSIHIHLQGNEGFFTKEMFIKMKPTAIIINTSRDAILEKGALLWALENSIIAGAGIDFIDDSELLEYSKTHNNLVLTNHIGGCTVEDMVRTEEFIIRQVNKYINEQTRTNK